MEGHDCEYQRQQADQSYEEDSFAQLEDRYCLEALDADSIPVLASFLDPRFKGLTVLDADEDKAAV